MFIEMVRELELKMKNSQQYDVANEDTPVYCP